MFSFKSHFSTKDEQQTSREGREIEKSIRHVKFNARYFSIEEQKWGEEKERQKICSSSSFLLVFHIHSKVEQVAVRILRFAIL
jgi:hypothetical protein